MRGFDRATILSPSFHGLRKERLAQWPTFCVPNSTKNSGGSFQKNWVGVCCTLQETLTLFQTKICDFPYPISDLIKNLIPYFIPEALEPGAWQNGRIQTKPAKKPYLWRGTYLYSLYKGLLPGAKNALQITSLAANASKTNKNSYERSHSGRSDLEWTVRGESVWYKFSLAYVAVFSFVCGAG